MPPCPRRRALRARGAATVLACVGDLPALLPGLGPAHGARGRRPYDRAFLADRSGIGTTMLIAAPWRWTRASAAGPPRRTRLPERSSAGAGRPARAGARTDVDTEADLAAAFRIGVGPATAAVLASSRRLRTISMLIAREPPGPTLSVQLFLAARFAGAFLAGRRRLGRWRSSWRRSIFVRPWSSWPPAPSWRSSSRAVVLVRRRLLPAAVFAGGLLRGLRCSLGFAGAFLAADLVAVGLGRRGLLGRRRRRLRRGGLGCGRRPWSSRRALVAGTSSRACGGFESRPASPGSPSWLWPWAPSWRPRRTPSGPSRRGTAAPPSPWPACARRYADCAPSEPVAPPSRTRRSR